MLSLKFILPVIVALGALVRTTPTPSGVDLSKPNPLEYTGVC